MQTTVENSMTIGLAGQLADVNESKIDTYVNNSKQLYLITMPLGSAMPGTVHTITINGNAYSYTELGGPDTAAQIALAIIAVINAGSEPIEITNNLDGTFTIMSSVTGTSFTCTVSSGVTAVQQIENSQTIPFGVFVTQDNELGMDNKCHLPCTAAQVHGRRGLGFSIHDHAHEQAFNNTDNDGYEAQSAISVLKEGRICVTVEEAVTPASVPYIRIASGAGGTQLGAVRASADSGTAAPLSIARFKTSASSGGIALLDYK